MVTPYWLAPRDAGRGKLQSRKLFEHAENVRLAEDDELLAIDFHFGARVLAVVNDIAGAKADLVALALVIELAGADGNHFALGRLFLGRVGEHDSAGGLLLRFRLLDDHTIREGFEFHVQNPFAVTLSIH